jgi:hypothetical protein
VIKATITQQRKSTAKDPAPRFKRDQLPPPFSYYTREGLKLIGRYGDWRSALCPFHQDKHPSLRINIRTGGFRCMVCDTKGGDVLAFHRLRTGLGFVDAAKALNAWEVSR